MYLHLHSGLFAHRCPWFFPQRVSKILVSTYDSRFLLPFMVIAHQIACYWCHLFKLMELDGICWVGISEAYADDLMMGIHNRWASCGNTSDIGISSRFVKIVIGACADSNCSTFAELPEIFWTSGLCWAVWFWVSTFSSRSLVHCSNALWSHDACAELRIKIKKMEWRVHQK